MIDILLRFWFMKKIEPLNPMPDGTCRTLKYQYQKNGIANFIRKGSFAATGIIEIEYEERNIRSE